MLSVVFAIGLFVLSGCIQQGKAPSEVDMLGLTYQGLQGEDIVECRDQACFDSNLKFCNPSRLVTDNSIGIYIQTIEGMDKEEYCWLGFAYPKVAFKEIEGKSMRCKVPASKLGDVPGYMDSVPKEQVDSICEGSLIEFMKTLSASG